MNSKKIGLLTLFYHNYNYGGILQAYSTYSFLTSKGYNCTEINYFSQVIRRLQRRHIISKGMRHPFRFVKEKVGHRLGSREYRQKYPGMPVVKAFDVFIDTEFQQTELITDKTISLIGDRFDVTVVGGDQVWNPTWSDKNYFLSFIKNGKKIAFSCSIGKDVLSYGEKRWLKENLSNLDVISVREGVANHIIKELGLNSVQIPDPVFLHSEEEWKKFGIVKKPIDEPYVFSYLLGEDAARRNAIKKFTKQNGLKVVTIPHIYSRINKNDIGYADIEVIDAGPREFVGLIANAEYVLTDSFHGTAFSLILNKPFRCFSRFDEKDTDSQNSRLLSLLKTYGEEDLYIEVDEIQELKLHPRSEEGKNNRSKITMSLREICQAYLLNTIG